MHSTAQENVARFIRTYIQGVGANVLDVGSYDVNGSLRANFESAGHDYTGLDIEDGPNVDYIRSKSNGRFDPFPFADGEFNVVVSSSCFEHDPMFWVTFQEMVRVCCGLIYLNVPSRQNYHAYPIDCWRFLNDAMQALADWGEVELLEHYVDNREPWCDAVGVFRAGEE